MVNFKTSKQTCRQGNGIWKGSQYRNEQDRDQQHEQHRNQEPDMRKLLCLPYLEHKSNDRVLSNTNFPAGPQRTSSGNCQETDTCLVRACHTPRRPLQNHPSGHLGGWATPWSAEEKLDGQHQRMDIPAHVRTTYNGLPQKKKTKKNPKKTPTTTKTNKLKYRFESFVMSPQLPNRSKN